MTSNRRVLVAEHDRETRALVAGALRRSGYEVVEAGDGADALDYLGDCLDRATPDPPDVVVADSRMAIVTGLQVLASLRHVRPAVPVILTDAFGDDRTRLLARRLGAASVFDKPFEVDRLCAAVEGLAPRRR